MKKGYEIWKIKMNKLLKLCKKKQEIISYLFWGFLTTIICWGSYSVFIYFFNILKTVELFAVVTSNILSWISATIFAFVTNKIFVFKSKCWQKIILIPEIIKFLSTRFVTGILEMILVPVLVFIGLNQTVFGVQGMFSKIIVSVLIVILNYILSKIFIFKKTPR